MTLALWLWIGSAMAMPDGFYHPVAIGQSSTEYSRAEESASKAFAERSAKVKGLAVALQEYEVALDALGDRASVDERKRLATMRRRYFRESAVIESFAQDLMEDFDGAFTDAMERALADVDGEVVLCAPSPGTPRLPRGPMGMSSKQVSCPGTDHSGTIADSMDGDAALRTAVDVMVKAEWPDLTVEVEAMPSGARSVQVLSVLRPLVKEELKVIARDDDLARTPFQAKIESEASMDELAKLIDQAQAISAETARKRASLADPILDAVEDVWAKTFKGQEPPSWCANPILLGGCAGEDVTATQVPELVSHRKVLKVAP